MTAVSVAIDRGRDAYARKAWREAFDAFSEADAAGQIGTDVLGLYATSAYMVGATDRYVSALEREFRAYADAADVPGAVRAAFWVGHALLFRGQGSAARGWFARAQRLYDDAGHAGDADDGTEGGWLQIPRWLGQMGIGDYEAGFVTADHVADIARRQGDADLLWLARCDQGRALMNLGRVDEGLRIVDEMFVVATEGGLSPVVAGILFCNTIAYCVDCFAFGSARDWTEALTRWCKAQPEMEEHFAFCLVHRAELMQLSGAWTAAFAEIHRAETGSA